MNKERLVFEVTDGVKTPEEVTPWEGGAQVSGDEIFSFLQFSSTQFLSWPLLGVRPFNDLNIFLLPTRVVWGLSQSLGEPILAFIGCKTGDKPNR